MSFRSHNEPVPVTIVTGYLGAGKTTLLNHILNGGHGRRIAVIMNEFGEVPIDHELVLNVDEGVYTLANGCICCTVRDDLVEVLEELMERRDAFDQIIVETTGLAEPGGIIMTFLTHPDAGETFVVDGIVTVVDALHLPDQLGRSPEVPHQIAYADLILLNKSDELSPSLLAERERSIRAINPMASIVATRHAEIDVDAVLDIGGFDPARIDLRAGGGGTVTHEADISAVGIVVPGSLDPECFERWVGELIASHHESIYRMKGILSIAGQPRRYIFQGVHALSNWQYGESWGERARESRFVLIGRDLPADTLRRGLQACVGESGSPGGQESGV